MWGGRGAHVHVYRYPIEKLTLKSLTLTRILSHPILSYPILSNDDDGIVLQYAVEKVSRSWRMHGRKKCVGCDMVYRDRGACVGFGRGGDLSMMWLL